MWCAFCVYIHICECVHVHMPECACMSTSIFIFANLCMCCVHVSMYVHL